MRGIKGTIIGNFFILIFSVVVFLNILLTGFVKTYYYDNTEKLLKNQLKVSTNLYNKYFSSSSLVENVYDNIDSFWYDVNAQVEILDEKGNLIMDSIGIKDDELLKTPDIAKALKGESERWVGDVDYYGYKVMIVSSPLKANEKIVGVIRLITSLEDVNNIINTIRVFFLCISVVVLFIGVMTSIAMANRIINPIKSLISVAEKMASGDLSIRTKIAGNDELGKLGGTLNIMADELEKREHLKNEFISSVSHELRTPLTAIKGWVITLNDDLTDKETLKIGFDVIENEADRLTVMVEELLDFSRLINEKISLRKTLTDINILTNHVENFMIPTAKEEGLNFEINIKDNLEAVYLDKDRLMQVLINIIDNSFKFTDKGGTVSLIVSKNSDNIKFIITDTGCGISREDLPRVKEKFFKGKNAKSKNGIGLSICDEIIKLHKGSFNIVSTLGIGTQVEISIPIEREQ